MTTAWPLAQAHTRSITVRSLRLRSDHERCFGPLRKLGADALEHIGRNRLGEAHVYDVFLPPHVAGEDLGEPCDPSRHLRGVDLGLQNGLERGLNAAVIVADFVEVKVLEQVMLAHEVRRESVGDLAKEMHAVAAVLKQCQQRRDLVMLCRQELERICDSFHGVLVSNARAVQRTLDADA